MTVSASRSVAVAGQATISYRDLRASAAGRSGTVVLLHSLGADGQMWDACLPALASAHRVLVPDARGHGASGPAPTASLGQWVDDLHAVLADADCDPVLMAGISMGGIQALAYAATYPGDVRALVVADSFAALDPAVAEAKIVALAGPARLTPMTQVADRYVADTFRTPLPAGAEAVRRALAGMDAASYIAAVEACFRTRVTDLLPRVKAPTLVLWGDRDAKTPRLLSEQIASEVAEADLRVVPDAGHLSNVDNPDAFAAEILQFSDMHAARARSGGPRGEADHG